MLRPKQLHLGVSAIGNPQDFIKYRVAYFLFSLAVTCVRKGHVNHEQLEELLGFYKSPDYILDRKQQVQDLVADHLEQGVKPIGCFGDHNGYSTKDALLVEVASQWAINGLDEFLKHGSDRDKLESLLRPFASRYGYPIDKVVKWAYLECAGLYSKKFHNSP